MSEWTDWHGGDCCPVDRDVMIDVTLQNGGIVRGMPAGRFIWFHGDSDGNIIKYRIHSDGKQESPTGTKHDQGKPRMDLLLSGFPHALESLGQVLAFGAEKYAPNNWKLVDDLDSRYQAAQMRHELSHCKGELLDEESGLPHITHEAFCILARLEHMLETQKKDD